MKITGIIIFAFTAHILKAHSTYDIGQSQNQNWILTNGIKIFSAGFLYQKEDTIVLLENDQRTAKIPISLFSPEDRQAFHKKHTKINLLHQKKQKIVEGTALLFWIRLLLLALLFSILLTLLQHTNTVWIGRYVQTLVGVFSLIILFSFFSPHSTDPLFIDSAFKPFKPTVSTRWDKDSFYVESNGIPDHEKMIGIKAWQQQVPIPQCYVGSNAWRIPLNPVLAPVPIPTKTNFFKGAIAIASNGIPVFNALNNRGEDSYLIGELDRYGGHCGRADDYHYHIAPLCLDSITSGILPIAFALDGYAVYGALEPDGIAMNELDINHGHMYNNVYHYHGTSTYPYMIANMVGSVTKDATDQIIPQAQTKAIRPAGNPLNGAVITNLVSTGINKYTLTYALNNQNYNVNYSWDIYGDFTFEWGSPSGILTNKYKGTICNISTAAAEVLVYPYLLDVYPNPVHHLLQLHLKTTSVKNQVKKITISDLQGRQVYEFNGFRDQLVLPYISPGVYSLQMILPNTIFSKKIMIL